MLHGLILPADNPQQAHRIRRLFMAAGASAMVTVLLYVSHRFGVLSLRAFVTAALLTLMFIGVFYGVFRSGLNLRFLDPSLTLLQILASTVVILYVLYESPRGHGVLSLIYMVSFLFGVFRLTTRELLGLTGFVALSYGLLISLHWRPGIDPAATRLMVLNWLVLVSVLTFFSVMGGYISRLRKEVADNRSRLQSALERIEDLAARDELTGVLNRRVLAEALTTQKNRADRYGTAFSVLIVDLDLFKRINDTHGHQAGDTVLKCFAAAAAQSLRNTDVFGRYGGEEFLAILDQTPLARVSVVAERLCVLTRGLDLDQVAAGLRITVSVGCAEYRPPEDWQATVERADQALYRAKNGGRDRFELETTRDLDPVRQP
jgi:diguanylate cyclase (GGDEF)-like protein